MKHVFIIGATGAIHTAIMEKVIVRLIGYIDNDKYKCGDVIMHHYNAS